MSLSIFQKTGPGNKQKKMTEVTCAIIIMNDRLLVTQRSEHMPHPLQWEFPGGKIQTGESPEACISREIREELGIEVKVEGLLEPVIHSYGEKWIRLIPLVCSIRSGEVELRQHRAFAWISRKEAEDYEFLEADARIISTLDTRWH